MGKGHEQTSKNKKWPCGTEKGEILSLPELPPEWETITDDPTINRVANLAHLALATALYSRTNNLSYEQRQQIGKLFEDECLSARGFFGHSGQDMKGNISIERVDFVKKGTHWVNDTDRWLHANWSGPINLDTWKDLVRRLYSLIEVHNVLWAISIEHFKSVETDVRAKLCRTLRDYEEETGENGTAGKGRRKLSCLKRTPGWIYALVIFVAALLTIFHLLDWLEPIKGFIYRILAPE